MAVNLLLSYAFHDKTDLAKIRAKLVCGLLLIDSGAFTAFSKGRPVDINAYAEFLERWRGCWDHAITLDVIGDGAASAVNTRKLHDRGLPVMPVFTRGDKLEDFDAMVRDVGYVCVGGLVGLPKAAQLIRVGMLQRRAADLGGGIHALGIGSMDILRKTRPYSADASTVSGAFRFGTVIYFNGERIMATQVTDRKKLGRDRDIIRQHGIDLAQLVTDGRMPKMEQRQALMKAMSVAYAAADEYLKASFPVPPPRTGTPGTHLYNSVVSGDVKAAAALDTALHPGPHFYNSVVTDTYAMSAGGVNDLVHGDVEQPAIWRRYGRRHTCNRKASTDAS